ncbi:MAG TPA: VOC family protein [Streptosporangiaceae bacterium]|jgi:predicted 3-demethylubiquinone-9 3-methyltransferase (glyoxalase superfamily)|nr:VOC family protein [Streptosporangiaceae bacterium]
MATEPFTTCLWFDTQAEAAAQFYTSVFSGARMGPVSRCGEAGPRPAGMVITAEFELNGQKFLALNGGPEYTFTEAISFQIPCADQDEVDYYWEQLTAGGGEPGPCGWLKDRFGLSWQVVPTVLGALLSDPDPEKAARATRAMLSMGKLDIAELERAHDGG